MGYAKASQRHVEIIREAEDQAVEAVGMCMHLSGTDWCNIWSCMDLLEKAMENGGTLTIPSFSKEPPKVLTVEGLVGRIKESLTSLSEVESGLMKELRKK